jgi:hypothetical protein
MRRLFGRTTKDGDWEVLMCKAFGVATVLIGLSAAVNAAPLSNSQKDATVISVDRGAKKFTAQSGTASSTYNTTDGTVFRVGTTPTSWTAVKAAAKVSIIYPSRRQQPGRR